MPRPARPWFRFYSDVLGSLKIHDLPDRQFRFWVLFMAAANTNRPRGTLPATRNLAFALHISEERVSALIDSLVAAHLIDVAGGQYLIHDWDEWQADRDVAPSLRDDTVEINHGNSTETSRVNHAREEERRDKEKDKEKEREAEAPPAHPFAIAFSQHYRQRHGQNPPRTQHAEALALEAEHGADWCFRAAEAFDWDKPPAYLRPWIIDHKEKANGNQGANGNSQPAAEVADAYDIYGRGVRPKFILDIGGAREGEAGVDSAGAKGGLEV